MPTVNLGRVKGDTGAAVELQNNGTHIQWREVGGSTWTDLVALSDITGENGSDAAVSAINVAAVINGAAEKSLLVSADRVPLTDSEEGGALKWASMTGIWTYIKGLLLKEFAYDPIPMGLGGTAGTANTSGTSIGNDVTLTLAVTSVVGNYRYTSSTTPIYPMGSGQPMRMADSRFTLFFDAEMNGLVGNEVWLSCGVPNASRLNGAAGWAIRWKDGGDIELQIHNGTGLQTLTVGNIGSAYMASYVAVWEAGSLSLYRRHSQSNAVPGRYALLGTLVGTGIPTSASSYYMSWVNECVVNGSFRAVLVRGFRYLREAVHPNT